MLGAVDVVFPVLHGPWGEDGTVQGLLEMAGVPYVGSGVLASAAAMDKAVAKVLLRAAGLPVADGVVVRQAPPVDREAVAALGLPVFVKPARGGSSIGISRVDDLADLDAALAVAHAADPKALVEARGRRPRGGVRRARRPGRARGQRPGRGAGVRRARVLRLRGEVPRGRHRARRAGRPAAPRSPTRLRAMSLAGLRGARLRGAGPGRLLRRRRRDAHGQRGQHDARASRRPRCTRGCGRPPASTTPRWSTGCCRRRCRAAPGCAEPSRRPVRWPAARW